MLTYQMNQRDEKSKYYYLYTVIKEDILSGDIKKNEKLPSKRTLAEHLGISLITVIGVTTIIIVKIFVHILNLYQH